MRPSKTTASVVVHGQIRAEDTRPPWWPVVFGARVGSLGEAPERDDGRSKRRLEGHGRPFTGGRSWEEYLREK